MSYLTDDIKQACRDIVSGAAQDWEKNIVIYKKADKTFISTDINSFVPSYGTEPQFATDQSYSPVSGTFPARVWWVNSLRQREENIPFVDVKEDVPDAMCRIKLRPDGYQFMSGVESVYIDGILTNVKWSNPRPHSIFGDPMFYDFYCTKVV